MQKNIFKIGMVLIVGFFSYISYLLLTMDINTIYDINKNKYNEGRLNYSIVYQLSLDDNKLKKENIKIVEKDSFFNKKLGYAYKFDSKKDLTLEELNSFKSLCNNENLINSCFVFIDDKYYNLTDIDINYDMNNSLINHQKKENIILGKTTSGLKTLRNKETKNDIVSLDKYITGDFELIDKIYLIKNQENHIELQTNKLYPLMNSEKIDLLVYFKDYINDDYKLSLTITDNTKNKYNIDYEILKHDLEVFNNINTIENYKEK